MARDLSQDVPTPAGDNGVRRGLQTRSQQPAPQPQQPSAVVPVCSRCGRVLSQPAKYCGPACAAADLAAQPAQVYGAPPVDEVQVALTWRLALGRKATEQDLLDEVAPHRNTVLRGTLSWLQSYAGDFEYLLDLRSRLNPRYGLSNRQACGVLNCMAAEARRNAPPVAPVAGQPGAPAPQAPRRLEIEDAGVYKLPDGAICRVQANREKTKVYAKRLTEIGGRRATEAGTRVHAEYVYEAGLVQRVAAEGVKLTLEEAKALTIRYGFCIRCGRHLTDAKSVEQGMGPVCIQYFS
jgi:hypothetical protein